VVTYEGYPPLSVPGPDYEFSSPFLNQPFRELLGDIGSSQ